MATLKSTAPLMGLLFSAIVLTFLAISTTSQIEHPEWGLVTAVILFGPSRRQTVRKSLFRFGATAAAGILVLLITSVAPSHAVATILVFGILVTGHLAIRFPDWAYYYFVFGVTLGILSIQTSSLDPIATIGVTVYQRLVQIGLATIITVPILLLYLKLESENREEPPSPSPNTSTHSEFLIRATLCALILCVLRFLVPIHVFALVYLITIISLSASAIIRDLSPIFKAAFVGAVAAIVLVLIIRCLWLLLPEVSILKILVVAILFGGIKTCSISSKSWSMAWELVLIFGSMLLAIEVSSKAPLATYLLVLVCLLTSVGIIALCQITGRYLARKIGVSAGN